MDEEIMKTFIRLDKLTLEDAENLYKHFRIATIYHNGKASFVAEIMGD